MFGYCLGDAAVSGLTAILRFWWSSTRPEISTSQFAGRKILHAFREQVCATSAEAATPLEPSLMIFTSESINFFFSKHILSTEHLFNKMYVLRSSSGGENGNFARGTVGRGATRSKIRDVYFMNIIFLVFFSPYCVNTASLRNT